jgi:speckle-type POZ protein
LLKITDYSLTKLATNGEQINSSTFRVGGRTWRVRYYPNGCQSKNTDYISLFLTLDDTAANTKAVKAQVHFSLLDRRGKPVPFYTGIAAPESLHLANSWGCDKFIKRRVLEKSEYLSNDCFIVKVDVVVVRGFHAQETPPIVVPPSSMSWHFGDLSCRARRASMSNLWSAGRRSPRTHYRNGQTRRRPTPTPTAKRWCRRRRGSPGELAKAAVGVGGHTPTAALGVSRPSA